MAKLPAKKLSTFVDRFVPDFIREEYPDYVNFIQGFCEFLESENEPYDVVVRLLQDKDIDLAINRYADQYRKTYSSELPDFNVGRLSLIIKNIREFYRRKGTIDSYKFLFRAYYDQECEIHFPTNDIVRASDGKWSKPINLFLVDINGNPILDNLSTYIGYQIKGTLSGDSGTIEGYQFVSAQNSPINKRMSFFSVTGSKEQWQQGEEVIISSGTVDTLVSLYIVDSPNAIVKTEGRFLTDSGMPSSSKKLQDNYYYQDLSYQIKVGISKRMYENVIDNAIHPAGFLPFGLVLLAQIRATDAKIASAISNWLLYMETITAYGLTTSNFTGLVWENNAIQCFGPTYEDIQNNRENRPYATTRFVGDILSIPIQDFVTKAKDVFPFSIPAEFLINVSLYFSTYINSAWLTYDYFMKNRTDPLLSQIVPIGALGPIQIDYYTTHPQETLPYTRTANITIV